MQLKEKFIVITGASKGLGEALAVGLMKEGSKVIISARNRSELNSVAAKVGVIAYPADVTNEKEVIKLARFAQKRFGRIDVWINNAGTTIPHSSIEEINIKSAHQVFEVNFFGTFYGSKVATAIMKRQRKGVILNIVSMSALVGRPRSLVYSASKWAVRGFTEGLRMANKPEHISVLAVHPGGMKTTIFGKHPPKGYEGWMNPTFVAKMVIKNLKRRTPKEEIIINK